MRRFISILLACVLATVLAVPALAAEDGVDPSTPVGIEVGEGFTASEEVNEDGNVVTTIRDQEGNAFTVEEVEGPINADEDYVDEYGNDDIDPTPTPEPTGTPVPTEEPAPESTPEAQAEEPSETHVGLVVVIIVAVCAVAAAAVLLIRKKKL